MDSRDALFANKVAAANAVVAHTGRLAEKGGCDELFGVAGYRNTATDVIGFESGFYNSGPGNLAGYFNTGSGNTGIANSGEVNTGISNPGNENRGVGNSGTLRSGFYNAGDNQSGFFGPV